ncbi:hypothetical protein ABZS58_43880, partial [Dactylosporangium sp. NPDC005555]
MSTPSRPADRRDATPVALDEPIAALTDPFAVRVHRPIAAEVADPADPAGPALPPYVRREHDERLARVIDRAGGGSSALAVLVGWSATGRTRACWEAVHRLPAGWRLWRPLDEPDPEAVLAQLPRLGRRTVVWLDGTDRYLDAPGGVGERVAAALRTLLASAHQAPVLVLGTLWPSHWGRLTRRGTPHVRAREVLDGAGIVVPAAFTGAALDDLRAAAALDGRLRTAMEDAQDGRVAQQLAGVPALLARYRAAPPAAGALIHAAMDARRLGHRAPLPLGFLAAAAPAYLTRTEQDSLGQDWLEQALAYTAAPCRGVAGLLGRIRRHDPADLGTGVAYRLADVIDEPGRQQRRSQVPPAGFWAAAAAHTFPADQATLGDAAHARGMFRDAGQLHKNAAAHGDRRGVLYLLSAATHLRTDVRTIRWAAEHTTLDDPAAVAWLLDGLRGAAAPDETVALLRRDPASHVRLDDPAAVAGLLVRLRGVDADGQVTALADRAAEQTGLDDPAAVATLLDGLRGVGAHDQ